MPDLGGLSPETLLGTGVFGLLSVLCLQIFRRQAQLDSQRLAATKFVIEAADQQRERAEARAADAEARADRLAEVLAGRSGESPHEP